MQSFSIPYRLILLLSLTALVSSCDLFESKEAKAIEICQKSKIQLASNALFQSLGLSLIGLPADATWLEYANMLAKENPTNKLDWSATRTEETDVYLVAFTNEEGWGCRWEVNIEQQLVKDLNDSEYLMRKYKLSRVDRDQVFELTDISLNKLGIENKSSSYSKTTKKEIVYMVKASVINKTDKTITKANISGELQLIFRDKTIKSKKDWKSGFNKKISTSNPWKPNQKLDFFIKTKGIEDIYLQYDPEFVIFRINLSAEDPIGFKYNRDIEEYDLARKWKTLKK